jgi:putative addiction module component (TIGR02574 family)
MGRPEEDDLSAAERILRLQDEGDEVAESPDDVELTIEQREELNRRLADHRLNPARYKTWGELRSELEAMSHDLD